MGKAQATIEITASSSKLGAGLAAARARFQDFAAATSRGIGAAFKKIDKVFDGPAASHAIGNFAGDLMSRGADAFLDAAQNVREFERDLTRTRITAGQSVEWQQALARSLHATSEATGVSSNELAKASGVYFDLTSDAEGMSKALDTFGKVALSSGANMDDIVRAAAAMKDNMGIGADELESAFSGLIQQGKAGKISLKDMGAEFPSLLAMFGKFGHGREGMMELGAAFQVGAKAFGSASQAATGLEAMMGMLQARQRQLKGVGVDVYKVNKDGSVTLRGLHEIIDQIQKKHIDPRKWGKIFGENKEGRNFLEMLLKFPDLYDDIVKASDDAGAVQRDAFAYATSDAGKLDLAMNRMKEAIAAAFTPERIAAFTDAVESLSTKLGPVVDGVGKLADIAFGNEFAVGKFLGEAFGGGNGNPFDADFMTRKMDEMQMEHKDKLSENERFRLERRVANREGFDTAANELQAASKNGRVTKEALALAAGNYYQYDPNAGPGGATGNLGARTAAEGYLKQAGYVDQYGKIDKDRLDQVVRETVQGVLPPAIQEVGRGMSDAIARSLNLKVGDNAVAAATTNATTPRRGAR